MSSWKSGSVKPIRNQVLFRYCKIPASKKTAKPNRPKTGPLQGRASFLFVLPGYSSSLLFLSFSLPCPVHSLFLSRSPFRLVLAFCFLSSQFRFPFLEALISLQSFSIFLHPFYCSDPSSPIISTSRHLSCVASKRIRIPVFMHADTSFSD